MSSPVRIAPKDNDEGFWSNFDFIKDGFLADEKVDNWFLISSAIPVLTITVAYLAFVLYIGPRFMKNRKPYNLKKVLIVYNLFQMCFNSYMMLIGFITPGAYYHALFSSCSSDYLSGPLELWYIFCEGVWYYFMSKLLDLCDTVFFVLRKKQSHVTFLHVYHHAMMVLSSWAYLRYIKGPQVFITGHLNCIVHVVMYSYYFLSAFGPGVQKYLWWKKYLTRLQLTQFVLICLHQASFIVFRCYMPTAITYYIIFQATLMIILFGNFYHKKYILKSKKTVKSK